MAMIESEQTLMRIFIGDNDRWEHRPLYEALVELFRREGFAGATVLKGAMGFGGHSITHTDKLLRLSSDLPVVVEVVEKLDRIETLLPRLDVMLQGGLVTLEKVKVLRFNHPATEKAGPC